MKILLDDGLSTTIALTGIGHQCLGLFQSLQALADVTLADYRHLRRFPRRARRAAYLLQVNATHALPACDVIHYINFYTPSTPSRAAKATTIHDLSMFLCPEAMEPQYLPYIRKAMVHSLQRADSVIVPSHAVQNEILEFSPQTPREKVVVCFNGLREVFVHQPEVNRHLDEVWCDKSFFLFVGTLEKRKNLPFLIKTFLTAHRRGAIAHETFLALVGKKGYGYEEIESAIAGDVRVKILGRLPDEEVAVLYRHSKALVFPSLYEGFGIPLLEAMSCNTPILRSEIAASREIDQRHHAQMVTFPLASGAALMERLAWLDRASGSVRAQLHYGDLSMYHFNNVARQHLEAYRKAVEIKRST